MVSGKNLRLVLPQSIRNLPGDIAAVMGLTLLTWVVVFVPVVRETALRVVLGAAFVLFAPGYAIVAVLFPESESTETMAVDGRSESALLPRFGEGLSIVERFTASVIMSVLVVPLFGLVLNFSSFDVELTTVAFSMSLFTVAVLAFAAVRRWDLPKEDRFRLPVGHWRDAVRLEFQTSETKLDRALNVVLLVSLLIAGGSAAYAVAGPQGERAFTEFYLLAENETGDLVADDYPTTFRKGQSKSLAVGISNHEGQPTDYVVIARLQQVENRSGDSQVVTSQRLDQFQLRADAGETVYRRHEITPTVTGEELRLQYLLYVDEVPANPSSANAYRQAHIWANVST